eukprot:2849215-Rhodomonas_salina.1
MGQESKCPMSGIGGLGHIVHRFQGQWPNIGLVGPLRSNVCSSVGNCSKVGRSKQFPVTAPCFRRNQDLFSMFFKC